MKLATVEECKAFLATRGIEVKRHLIAPEGQCWKGKPSGQYLVKLIYTKDGGPERRTLFGECRDRANYDEGFIYRTFCAFQLKREGLCKCDRCGGAGGAQKWPGWTCYRCGGIGTDPNWMARLNRGIRTAAKEAAKTPEQRAAEAEELKRQQDEYERQRVELEAAAAKREEERKAKELEEIEQRRASTHHIGTIGARAEFVATVVHVTDGQRNAFGGISYFTVLKDDAGNTIIYRNYLAAKGERVTFKATIAGHMERANGEKQTLIQRAKVIEAKEAA